MLMLQNHWRRMQTCSRAWSPEAEVYQHKMQNPEQLPHPSPLTSHVTLNIVQYLKRSLCLPPLCDLKSSRLIIILLMMSSRCFAGHCLISGLLQSDLLVYNDECEEGAGGLMCQRLAVKSSHLSVLVHVCSIIMLPCPRHQRPVLLRGVVSGAIVSLGIVYHKGCHCIVRGCVCVCVCFLQSF